MQTAQEAATECRQILADLEGATLKGHEAWAIVLATKIVLRKGNGVDPSSMDDLREVARLTLK